MTATPRWRPWWLRSILVGSPLWAAHWSLQGALRDFLERRRNALRRRPMAFGTFPNGRGWSASRGQARMVWGEVFDPGVCTNACVPAGWRFPRPGAGFGARAVHARLD